MLAVSLHRAVGCARIGSLALTSDEDTWRRSAQVVVLTHFALQALVLKDAGFVPHAVVDQDVVALSDRVAWAVSVSAVSRLLPAPLHLQFEASG